jgi:hypothetical protein
MAHANASVQARYRHQLAGQLAGDAARLDEYLTGATSRKGDPDHWCKDCPRTSHPTAKGRPCETRSTSSPASPSSDDETAYKQQLGDVLKPILEASEQGLTPLANAVGNELHGFVTVLRATMSLLVEEMDVGEWHLMQAIEKAIEKLVSGQEGQH